MCEADALVDTLRKAETLVDTLPFEVRGPQHLEEHEVWCVSEEGRCKATWKREVKISWREAGPRDHHDDKVDSDQYVFNEELCLCKAGAFVIPKQA